MKKETGSKTYNLTIVDLLRESHSTALDKGWWEGDRNFGDQISNFHGEVSEAWEEYRKYGLDPTRFLYPNCTDRPGKPEGIAAELADVLIRIADTCAHYDIPLEKAILDKLQYNKTRPYRHGGKKA
jgi:NTP pyrophosphatase (non-canonical NTP hydrolase)